MPREYSGEKIAVGWDPKLCIHAGECGRGMADVFDPNVRPWVNVGNAQGREEELAAVIRRCPSGALHYRMLDDGATEPAGAPMRVVVQPDGPLYVQGALEVRDGDGGLIREDVRLALCRCGDSKNKPFCDNSHIEAGFEAP